MKRTINSVILVFACLMGVSAQQAESRSRTTAGSEVSGSVNDNLNIQSGTTIKGTLQNSLDARKAKVGDPVILKTTEPVKSNGRKVVGKGAKLLGHVTEVSQKTKSSGDSRIGILFDTLQDGSLAFPITATISSITANNVNTRANDEDIFRGGSDTRSSSGASASGSGGLVGGATNAVGSVVGGTTNTVGSVVDTTAGVTNSALRTTTNTAGSATGALASLSRIQINESAGASAEGSSVLSLSGDNIRLEKGTNFNLVVSQSAEAGASKQP